MVSTVIKPFSIVKLNGLNIPFLEWGVSLNAVDHAGTFEISISIQDADNDALFHSKDDAYIQIFYGLSFNNLWSIINGYADEIKWEMDQGKVSIRGRDCTGLLIDHKLSKSYKNLRVSDVVTQVANEVGLTPVIQITGPSLPAGKIVNGEHILIHSNTTAWDLLTKLAQYEDREVFVDGTNLVYRDHINPLNQGYLRFRWGENIANLTLDRTLRNSKDIQVTVKSWHSPQKTAFSYTATRNDLTPRELLIPKNTGYSKKGRGHRQPVEYLIIKPNLPQTDVKNLAQNLADSVTRYEVVATFHAPITQQFSLDNLILIEGIPFIGQQVFYPTQIRLGFNVSQGALAEFTCINHILPIQGKITGHHLHGHVGLHSASRGSS